jgi:Transposase, Mutator family
VSTLEEVHQRFAQQSHAESYDETAITALDAVLFEQRNEFALQRAGVRQIEFRHRVMTPPKVLLVLQNGVVRASGVVQIVALYAKELSTREVTTHLEELYGVEVSATLISNVTDAVSDEIKAWQSRPLESI